MLVVIRTGLVVLWTGLIPKEHLPSLLQGPGPWPGPAWGRPARSECLRRFYEVLNKHDYDHDNDIGCKCNDSNE